MNRRRAAAAAASLASVLIGAVAVHAFDPVTWHTSDGGGIARVTSGAWTLGGTIGQPDAGSLAAGGFTLRGGFWRGGRTSVVGVPQDLPVIAPFRFQRATPNPLRSQSQLGFDLPAASRVRLSIHDVAGRVVSRHDFGVLAAGHHERLWSAVDDGARPLTAGVYFLRLEAGGERAVQKVLVIP